MGLPETPFEVFLSPPELPKTVCTSMELASNDGNYGIGGQGTFKGRLDVSGGSRNFKRHQEIAGALQMVKTGFKEEPNPDGS